MNRLLQFLQNNKATLRSDGNAFILSVPVPDAPGKVDYIAFKVDDLETATFESILTEFLEPAMLALEKQVATV